MNTITWGAGDATLIHERMRRREQGKPRGCRTGGKRGDGSALLFFGNHFGAEHLEMHLFEDVARVAEIETEFESGEAAHAVFAYGEVAHRLHAHRPHVVVGAGQQKISFVALEIAPLVDHIDVELGRKSDLAEVDALSLRFREERPEF